MAAKFVLSVFCVLSTTVLRLRRPGLLLGQPHSIFIYQFFGVLFQLLVLLWLGHNGKRCSCACSRRSFYVFAAVGNECVVPWLRVEPMEQDMEAAVVRTGGVDE